MTRWSDEPQVVPMAYQPLQLKTRRHVCSEQTNPMAFESIILRQEISPRKSSLGKGQTCRDLSCNLPSVISGIASYSHVHLHLRLCLSHFLELGRDFLLWSSRVLDSYTGYTWLYQLGTKSSAGFTKALGNKITSHKEALRKNLKTLEYISILYAYKWLVAVIWMHLPSYGKAPGLSPI